MYELKVEGHFSSSHSLKDYPGDCAKMHGHNWKVEATFTAEKLNHLGMAVDFKDLKKALKEVLDQYDHKHLNDLDEFQRTPNNNPTAENISRILFERLSQRVNFDGVRIGKVTVWETPTCACSFYAADQ
jgi:6-pyruvoyltetrahydropterin/6-carboxytetrahydropterin synthase